MLGKEHGMHIKVMGILFVLLGIIYIMKDYGYFESLKMGLLPIVVLLFGLMTMCCCSEHWKK